MLKCQMAIGASYIKLLWCFVLIITDFDDKWERIIHRLRFQSHNIELILNPAQNTLLLSFLLHKV